MEFSAQQIAQLINGRIEGDENITVNTFAKIEEGSEGAISFLASPKYLPYLYETKSSIILVDNTIQIPEKVSPTLIWVDNVRDCIARLLQMVEATSEKRKGISSLAFTDESAKIADDVYVGEFAYIGKNVTIEDGSQIYPHAYVGDNVHIGSGCCIYPNVTIYHNCVIGNRVIIHAGAVIGADGFGFAPTPSGYDKIPQIGNVVIEDDVEIGANTCVDRSTMGSTFVRKGVKLDNLVQIAHNTDIGQNTVMSAQVGIAGSTKVGQWCMFGGQVGIAGHIKIGDKVFLGAQAGVPSSLADNQVMIGTPAMPKMAFFKSQAIYQKLPELYKQIAEMQKEIEELRKNK